MNEQLLLAFAIIAVLGVGSLWAAWWLRFPSILLLLLLGFLAGAAGLLKPDEQFGDVLLPVVSLSVGIILYEGGLSLRFAELRGSASVVWKLVTIGAAITWIVAALAAKLVLGLPMTTAVLLGAILVVTGPTVIGPMLQHIRPSGAVGPVLKWEGIVIDPIGALLAVLVFEVIAIGNLHEGTAAVFWGITKTIGIGGTLGLSAGLLLALLLRSFLIPDFLENAVSLMFVVGVYTAADHFQAESGLLATTVMGVTLANQKLADVKHIVEFKENLRVLLISSLFIVLAARLRIEQLQMLDPWRSLAFLAVLVLIARPLGVAASCLGSSLSKSERVFLAWLAPRGIVAAAVSSVFALRLQEQGVESAAVLVPITFLVIIGTVLLYGLSAPALAHRLGVADPSPQGVLMLGADEWARTVAKVLKGYGFRVLLVDTNRRQIAAARMDGLETCAESILAEHVLDDLDLGGLGRLIAATSNDWVNALAAQRFARIFRRDEVYQLPPWDTETDDDAHRHLHGRWLFDEGATYGSLHRRMDDGAIVKATGLTEEFTYESYRELYGDRAVPMFVITESGRLAIVTAGQTPSPKAGDTVIALVREVEAT